MLTLWKDWGGNGFNVQHFLLFWLYTWLSIVLFSGMALVGRQDSHHTPDCAGLPRELDEWEDWGRTYIPSLDMKIDPLSIWGWGRTEACLWFVFWLDLGAFCHAAECSFRLSFNENGLKTSTHRLRRMVLKRLWCCPTCNCSISTLVPCDFPDQSIWIDLYSQDLRYGDDAFHLPICYALLIPDLLLIRWASELAI